MKTATARFGKAFDGVLRRVLHVQRLLSEATVLVMVLLIAAEVICRSVLGFSLMVVEELSGYLLVALVFMSMGIALRDGALFRVTFLVDYLAPRFRWLLQGVFDLCCLAGMLVLTWHLGALVVRSWWRDVQAATTLATPLYLPQSIMVLGACTVVLVLLAQLWQTLSKIRRGG